MTHKRFELSDLIAQYERPREHIVQLPAGKSGTIFEFRFVLPSSYSEMRSLAERSQSFADRCRPSACEPGWEPYLPDSRAAAVELGYLASLSNGYRAKDDDEWIEMTEFDWLQFAHHCGLETSILINNLSSALIQFISESETEKLTALGED